LVNDCSSLHYIKNSLVIKFFDFDNKHPDMV